MTADFAKSPTALVFIRLTVKDGSGNVLGDTLYWHNWKDYMHYELLNLLPEVRLNADISSKSVIEGEIGDGNDMYIITLSNNGSAPAVQTRIRTVSSATDTDILPVFYSDNYFALMPGESKTVAVGFNPKYLRGGQPVFRLSGWNTKLDIIGGAENGK